jgi:DNA-binding response OmpR family regulator
VRLRQGAGARRGGDRLTAALPDIPRREPLRTGPLELRPEEYGVLVEGRRLHFTLREFEILWALANEPDKVVLRNSLYERIWGIRMRHRDRSVDAFVGKVRIKLAAAAPRWEFIHTHRGIGYRFAPHRRDRGA